MLALGLASGRKQHVLVLVPFLLLYRDFGAQDVVRVVCVADFVLDETASGTSLSLWRFLPSGLGIADTAGRYGDRDLDRGAAGTGLWRGRSDRSP